MAQECAPVTEGQVEKLFDRWNASLATLDPEKVVANYEDDAVLLATLSNQPRLTQDERRAYFVDFLKKKPQGVVDSRTIKLGCNTAIDTGVYTFTMGDGTKVPARYTFTYDYDGGKWLISSHHSSAMPERTS
ncbi:SgcJ/EcaC family oxidoreductase [Agrobacterium vitis]|uniref:SgcJ/EcaC family oxidoreductase n=1 Tax=Agrobacterium vitis TaxID=373 RepID=UPI003D270609